MITRRFSVTLVLFLCIATLLTQLTPVLAQNVRAAKAPNVTLESLTPGKVVSGFRTVAVYTDESDKLLGARFIHTRTNFTLDLLRIQSVPQGHIWVNSFPTSDMGEPHTQEHLLLGKGSVGRAVASLENMSLATSSAFTEQ